MAGNQHGFGESGSGAIGEPAMQILFAGPGNGMEQEVEAPPAIPDFCKHGIKLSRFGNIARREDRCGPLAGKRFNERPCRSEEHTSELQSLMRNSYTVFCLKKN